ncbi:MAG TPA: adenylate/guanylate cyclase domain-containing protein [Candidatus Dormibacteraeota bacterium]|nr:adenylate/guanylate cyclase domain-containing protein [Candidatus Dormibacteraeota bacterium]
MAWLGAERRRLRRRLDAAAGELQRMQAAFGQFAPGAVVDRIVARGGPNDAERRQVTVLFADLFGFTALGETLTPEALVALLNDYFGRMSRVVEQHRGQVSKFIGDGMMAVFGAHAPNPWQVNDAVHAALAMQQALADHNAARAAAGGPPLRVGIGVHTGPAVAGILGSQALMEFTVIGGTVNLASRVERLTRTHDAAILVTDAVRARLDPRFRLQPMPATAVRGVGEPVATWAVVGWDEDRSEL